MENGPGLLQPDLLVFFAEMFVISTKKAGFRKN